MKRLPEVVSALNNEVTRLTGKKLAVAITEKAVAAKRSTPFLRPVGVNEKQLPSLVNVLYLYQPEELEGGAKRARDPVWSFKVYSIEKAVRKPNEPIIYYLRDGPKRGLSAKNCWLSHPIPFSLRPTLTKCEIRLVRCVSRRVAPSFCCSQVTIRPPRILKPLLVAMPLLSPNADLKRCHVISFCFFDIPFVLNFFFSPSNTSMK